MKRFTLVLIACIFGVSVATSTASQTYVDDTITRGCVIRLYEDSPINGPAILENSTHVCDLTDQLSITGTGRLKLHGTPSLPIKSMYVAPDESLVGMSVTAGPSGGSGDIEIQFASNGNDVWATNDAIACSYCNVWVGATYYLAAP